MEQAAFRTPGRKRFRDAEGNVVWTAPAPASAKVQMAQG